MILVKYARNIHIVLFFVTLNNEMLSRKFEFYFELRQFNFKAKFYAFHIAVGIKISFLHSYTWLNVSHPLLGTMFYEAPLPP